MTLPPRPAHLTDLEFTRVFTTYVHSAVLVAGRDVLDAGCGTGHGSWLYRRSGARRVVAVDLDPHGLRTIAAYDGNLERAVMDVQALALRDRLFDLISCFEVIEHVPSPTRLLAELRRVARADGLVLISTPNRVNRLGPGQQPWNPEHYREYDLAGLQAELLPVFPVVRVLGTYGIPRLHEHYLREWSVGQRSSRLRSIARRLVPHGTRRMIRAALVRRQGDAFAIPEPSTDPWPFWIDSVANDCLNFVAVCGADQRMVSEAADRLRDRAR